MSNIAIADRHRVLLSCLSAAICQKRFTQLIDRPSIVRRCLCLSNKYTPGRQRTIALDGCAFRSTIFCFNTVKWKTEFCERAFPIHRRVVKQTRRFRIKPAALIFFTSCFPLDHVPMVRLSKIHTRANPRRSRRSKRDWCDREPR